MNYKKRDDIPAMPADLAQDCINYVETQLANNGPMIVWYKSYEHSDTNSLSFVVSGTELDETDGKETGGIGFYGPPDDLTRRLAEYCKSTNDPDINFDMFALQLVNGSSFLGPHVDAPSMRAAGFLYLLKSGGPDVRTVWYNTKPEYSTLQITDNTYIPYSKLDVVENHRLEENMWHWMNFNAIHSVENQQHPRIGVWGFKTT